MLIVLRLRECLPPRVVTAVSTVVLDLSQVTFLGAAEPRVLLQAALCAEQHQIRLRLVTDSRFVDRALWAADMTDRSVCCLSVIAVRASG